MKLIMRDNQLVVVSKLELANIAYKCEYKWLFSLYRTALFLNECYLIGNQHFQTYCGQPKVGHIMQAKEVISLLLLTC